MKSCCLLKGVIALTLLLVQRNVFAQATILPASAAEQPTVSSTDSLRPQATFNLLSFTGVNGSSQNTLTWKTDSRAHFSSFILERGIGETDFAAIGNIEVIGSSKTNSYTYVDNKPVAGRSFYRLKMLDSSGSSTYSSVISITHIPVSGLQIHYDAVSGTVGITAVEAGSPYQLKVYNCNGQMMLQKTVTTASPLISISQLPHGLYVVYATDGTAAPVSQKIIW